MINNRGKIFLYKSYIFSVEKIVNDMFSELSDLKTTCSISRDFVSQLLILEKAAEKISKNTAMCTNFKPIFIIVSEIVKKRQEIFKDIRKIENFCDDFKNCALGIKNYKNESEKIFSNYNGILRKRVNICDVNIFFLKFMIHYNNFSVLLIQNALKYRICPQLRLILQYHILLIKKENMKMEEILNLINKSSR